MKVFVYTNKKSNINDVLFEVVETKGKGHPDNICDTLAEKISSEYSKYCMEHYGVILRHMIDKLSILGGGSKVKYGGGEMISPIRILINGRFTDRFQSEKINYMVIVKKIIKDYFNELFPMLDFEKHVVIVDNTHHNEGPGVVYNDDDTTNNEREKFFEVVSKGDFNRHNNHFRCNDTSTTVSYYPMSNLEKTVLEIEMTLNSQKYKEKYPWTGNDIKVMGMRKGSSIEITSCVPLISLYVKDLDDYINKLKLIRVDIQKIIKKHFKKSDIQLYLNTRDDYEKNDMYMTLTGSAIESGDEGSVGRGNRSRGVIPFSRSFSMEAACGKNPVYHTGKLFTAIGDAISEKIYKKFGLENVVYCTTKMGDSIENPWNISVELNEDVSSDIKKQIEDIVNEKVKEHYNITKKIVNRKIKVNNY